MSMISLINGLLVLCSPSPNSPSSIHLLTYPPGILKSLPLRLPEEIKASPSHCRHVTSEWAGSVSSWVLCHPCKAPSVLYSQCCGRGCCSENKKKKMKFIIKTQRINGVGRRTVLNENSSSPVPVSGLPLWHLTNRGSQGAINSAAVLISRDLFVLFRDGLMTIWISRHSNSTNSSLYLGPFLSGAGYQLSSEGSQALGWC